MLALVLVATFVASAVGEGFSFRDLYKYQACGLSSTINTNWKQLGLERIGQHNWLARFSVCERSSEKEVFWLMAQGNKLQEWKLTFPDSSTDDDDVACEKLHEIDMSHEKNNILVYASYQNTVADSNVADCQVKNLVFANDYSKSNPSDIDWREVKEFLLNRQVPGANANKIKADAQVLYKEIIDSVTTYQMSGATIHQTFGQFNKTVALGLLEVLNAPETPLVPFENFNYELKTGDCEQAFDLQHLGLTNFKLCYPTSFDRKWYIRVVQTVDLRQRRNLNAAKFFPYYDPLMVYAPPSRLFARPPPVS